MVSWAEHVFEFVKQLVLMGWEKIAPAPTAPVPREAEVSTVLLPLLFFILGKK
jgi:hypothetical protein